MARRARLDLLLRGYYLLALSAWSSGAYALDALAGSAQDRSLSSRDIIKDDKVVFQTEPTLQPMAFDVKINPSDRRLLSRGHFFLTPAWGNKVDGLQIYDQDGILVYNGWPEPYHRYQDFHACDYGGTLGTHLCWGEMHSVHGDRHQNRYPAQKLIADKSYRLIHSNNLAIGDAQPNLHEYNVVNYGASYLQPVYPGKSMDLRQWGGPEDGMIWDSCFQDITFDAKLLFQWCWSDHAPVNESTIMPNDFQEVEGFTEPRSKKSGNGTYDAPMDPWHLNSVDRDGDGNYLISGRHSDQVAKIAGPKAKELYDMEPGDIVWRLGGKTNELEIEGDDFKFTKQHGVRLLSNTRDETVFYILDNAWEGVVEPSAPSSSGMTISVKPKEKKAKLLHTYPHPDGAISGSQGNMQVLPNKNVLMGWGELPDVTEYAEDGTVLWHASWGILDKDSGAIDISKAHSYRTWKSIWHGMPKWKPKLLTYSSSCDLSASSPLKAWVSWNGATEVRRWRFAGQYTADADTWTELGAFPKKGFETQLTILNSSQHSQSLVGTTTLPYRIRVQALDQKGTILSGAIATIGVPIAKLLKNGSCTSEGCERPLTFDQRRTCPYTSGVLPASGSTDPSGHNHLTISSGVVFVIFAILAAAGYGLRKAPLNLNFRLSRRESEHSWHSRNNHSVAAIEPLIGTPGTKWKKGHNKGESVHRAPRLYRDSDGDILDLPKIEPLGDGPGGRRSPMLPGGGGPGGWKSPPPPGSPAVGVTKDSDA